MEEIGLEEAMKVIEEYPDLDRYIKTIMESELEEWGRFVSNSSEIATYWHKCNHIVNANKI